MEVLLNALKNTEYENLKERMYLIKDTFITHRQIGESEAVYKIFPDFHFKESNLSTVFFPNQPSEQRNKFLIKVDDKPQYAKYSTVKISDREGEYIEKYDIVSKYQRRDGLEKICAAQFVKMYEPSWKKPTEKNTEKPLARNDRNKFHFVMTNQVDVHGEYLPQTVRIIDPFPDEPPFMKKRKTPLSLRFHKVNKNTDTKAYFFSDSLLYVPFRSEEELWNKLEGNLVKLEEDIRNVKSQVMEFLDSNEEARLFVDEALKTQQIACDIDPQGEQENIDSELEGQILHPDYQHLNPEELNIQMEERKNEKRFRAIEVDERNILAEKTRNLDFYQRMVVEKGIRFARNIVKSRKIKNMAPAAFNTIVLGGAGSGKSTVINVLKQWLHLILKREGDNPDNPYVVVLAPTGTAAANVRGQTLHSALGFNFGNKHYSLSDKKRDETRNLLKNLKVIIIDEMSMIRSDLLYQLDLRLREVMQKEKSGLVEFLSFSWVI